MKKPENKFKAKKIKMAVVNISFFMILLFCLIINNEVVYGSIVVASSHANKVIPPDSSLIKLQAAIDLAKANPDEANYLNLSLLYFQNAMYNECIWATQNALKYNPSSYIAYNNMCSAYNALGKWDEAIVAGQNAITVIPGAQLVTNNLQISINGKIKLNNEITNAETLVKTAPNEENLLSLGYLYYRAKNFELSINTYKKVIEINKKSVIAYNNICSAYNELGKWAEASVYCEKALAVDPAYNLSINNLKIAKDNLKKK
jgi:tetratricopeptide (TPR) repeat protein